MRHTISIAQEIFNKISRLTKIESESVIKMFNYYAISGQNYKFHHNQL